MTGHISIHEYLNVPKEWPIKENVKYEIVLMPNTKDIRTANRKDPRSCALAKAACRQLGVPHAAIGAACSYIPLKDSKGSWYIARMHAPKSTRDAIRQFDSTGEMPVGGFRFQPVRVSDRFKNKRNYMRKWHAGKVERTQPDSYKPKNKRKLVKIKTRTIPMNVRLVK